MMSTFAQAARRLCRLQYVEGTIDGQQIRMYRRRGMENSTRHVTLELAHTLLREEPSMISRTTIPAAAALALLAAWPMASNAELDRPAAASLPAPPGATKEQVLLGDRIFHGEAANGKCSVCHGADAKGTGNGNDLTLGMWIWGDGSLRAIKATLVNNMTIAPGRDGDLTPEDVDAVVAYVWAIGHLKRPGD
jgi:mono/diheme cytochrome c family protein